MLYDPKWEKPADVMSVRSLIAWLERQPADKEYCYLDHGHCLIGDYLRSCGFSDIWVGGFTYRHSGTAGERRRLPDAFEDVAADFPRTYGAALERAREFNR